MFSILRVYLILLFIYNIINKYCLTFKCFFLITNLASGRNQLWLSYHLDLLQAQYYGVYIISVLSISHHPLNSIMTLKNNINSSKDLKDKK